MNDDFIDTRQPRNEEDYAAMIMHLLKASTMADAYNRVSALIAIAPLVWARVDTGQLEAAPDLTVGATFQLIRFLEGRTVR